MTNWDAHTLQIAFQVAGYDAVRVEEEVTQQQYLIAPEQVARWFADEETDRPSYARHLARTLSHEQIESIRNLFKIQLQGKTCSWNTRYLYS